MEQQATAGEPRDVERARQARHDALTRRDHIIGLEAEVATLQAEVQRLTGKVDTLKGRLAEMREKLVRQRRKANQLERQLSQQQPAPAPSGRGAASRLFRRGD